MPSLSSVPSDINYRRLTRALKKKGFFINKSGGNGSHVKVVWPKNGKSVTIPCKIYKNNAKHYIESLEKISNITAQDIIDAI
jgi:predicted RNA binding protein YcfA (HicA-like mRNA interferase family)